MSQIKLEILCAEVYDTYGIEIHDDDIRDICIAEAKTKKTAYKRAAVKLRKLADEAERLAEES